MHGAQGACASKYKVSVFQDWRYGCRQLVEYVRKYWNALMPDDFKSHVKINLFYQNLLEAMTYYQFEFDQKISFFLKGNVLLLGRKHRKVS